MSPAPSTSDTIRARDALAASPADLSHGDWVRIAMAIKAAGLERQALHAAVLGFVHPVTGEALRFETPLPSDMAALESLLQDL